MSDDYAINLVNKTYKYKLVNYSSVIEAKVEASLSFYRSLDNQIDEMCALYLDNKIPLTLTWSSKGITDAFGFIARLANTEAMCISHGTVSRSYYDLDKIYKRIISESVIFNNYPSIAIQSPLAKAFFKENISKSKKVTTGNLMFSSVGYQKWFRRVGREKIIYAVTVKPITNMQFVGVETYDEIFLNIIELNRLLSHKYRFVVQVHPTFGLLFKRHRALFPGVEFTYRNIEQTLGAASALISFSSTAIEDALNARVPVILFDRYGRYKHCESLDLEKEHMAPCPAYYIQKMETLRKFFGKIICHDNSKNINWEKHIYTNNYRVNFINYIKEAIGKRTI